MNFVKARQILRISSPFLKNIIYFSQRMTSNLAQNRRNIVWIDMEMSGLNPRTDRILEIACVITDSQLNIIAEKPEIIIHESDEVLNNMNEWCTLQHGQSGLTEASRNSSVDLASAEDDVLKFIMQYAPEKTCPMAGNSAYMDRVFIKDHMPKIDDYLNYRLIDVSTVKELCKRWNKKVYHNAPEKKLVHRSLSDIKESIVELQHYKNNLFIM